VDIYLYLLISTAFLVNYLLQKFFNIVSPSFSPLSNKNNGIITHTSDDTIILKSSPKISIPLNSKK